MTVSLRGKTAIVTGAAVGIGPAYAQALAAEGVNVAVCDIREEILELPAQLEASGVKSVGWVADVSVPEDVRKVVDGTIEALGGIDILISNAGKCWVSVADDDLDKVIADYDGMIGTNLKGEYLMGRAVIAQLLEQGRGGEIVNVATDHMVTCGSPFEICPKLDTCPWADEPRPTGGGDVMDIYDASKWGLNGFLFGWAKALRPHGIRVNGMCMGATDSWMIRDFFGFPQTPGKGADEEQQKEVDTWMRKEDTAQVVMDLLKEGPDGRTAQNINLCLGRPTKLEPPLPNVYITEESLNVTS
ncbi:MAG: SDR family oxidoreductase [Gammaproteobacteria bacterium]|nr:SDR family oxidoreductase [Gammaproteobacteria bacterium]